MDNYAWSYRDGRAIWNRYLMLGWLLLLSCFSLPVNGQTDQPQSRWLTTAGVGIDLDHSVPVVERGTAINGIISRQLTLAQHYRFTRLFDLGLQLGWQRTVIDGSRDVVDVGTGVILQTNWSSVFNNMSIGVQPRLNCRIGQGDIALAGAIGWVSHRNTTNFRSPELGRVNFSAAPLLDFYYGLKLSYTYWPTASFGIEINLQRTDLRHGERLGAGSKYDFTPDNFINPTQAFDPQSFQFAVATAQAYFVGLAIVRRW